MASLIVAVIILVLFALIYLGKKAYDYYRTLACGKAALKAWQIALFISVAALAFIYMHGDEVLELARRAVVGIETIAGENQSAPQPPPTTPEKAEADRQKQRADREAFERQVAEDKKLAAEAQAEHARREQAREAAARREADRKAKEEAEKRRKADRQRAEAQRALEEERKRSAADLARRIQPSPERDAARGAWRPQPPKKPAPRAARQSEIAEGDADLNEEPAIVFVADNAMVDWTVLPIRPSPGPLTKPVLINVPRGSDGIVPTGEQHRVWEPRCSGFVIWLHVEFAGVRGWVNGGYVQRCHRSGYDGALTCRPAISAARNACAHVAEREPRFPF